jgi:hypothetical protein
VAWELAMNELDFEDLVLANLDEAERLTGHNFKGVRDLIDKHGAVDAARMLIDINMVLKEYSGFKILDAHDLERLSIEQAIVDFAESGLFTPAEVSAARSRLWIVANRKKREASR